MPTLRDGFEDGDFTSNPTWSVVDNVGGSFEVTSEESKVGSFSLRGVTNGNGTNDNLNVRGPSFDSSLLTSGDKFSHWYKSTDAQADETGQFKINDSSGNRVALFYYSFEGNIQYFTDQTNGVLLSSRDANKWYKGEIIVESDSKVSFVLKDAQENVIAEARDEPCSVSEFDYIKLRNPDNTPGQREAYWDEVSYGVESSSNGGEPAPDIKNFNRKKKLDVDSVSGSPTVNKAQPIIISGGDDSITGNGDIVIDFSNVAGPEDIAVFDENGSLLDYEIESLDTANETAVLWAYEDWVRDGTTQAQLAYGDNSANTDRQNVTATWNHSGQNAVMVQHLSGNATDSTSNNNDGVINGPSSSTDGQYAGTFDWDGADDDITISDDSTLELTSNFTIMFWAKREGSGGKNPRYVSKDSGSAYGMLTDPSFNNNDRTMLFRVTSGGTTQNVDSGVTPSLNTYEFFVGAHDGSNAKVFVDASQKASTSVSSIDTNTQDLILGDNPLSPDTDNFDGKLDAVRIYSDFKGTTFQQAELDASPNGGQVFFSQQSAESSGGGGGGTVTVAAAESLGVSDNRQRFSGRVFSQVTGLSADTSSAVSKVLGEGFAVVDAFRATGPVTGTVTLNGSPVEGAVVYAFNNTQDTFVGSTTTDVNGRYAFQGVEFNGDEILVAVDHDTGTGRFGDEKSTVV